MPQTLRLRDDWEAPQQWTFEEVNESEGGKIVDGQFVIGRVAGRYFVPGGNSQNERHYTVDLWEHVLGQTAIKHRLQDRLMFGMIGHEDKPITEEDLREGRVSHIITKLEVRGKGEGFGEALILNTPSGQNLRTYFRAGAKLKPSSRASGTYESGRTHNGLPIVDKATYILETFDFVLMPGFLEVNPTLVESKNKTNTPMENEVVKILTESRDALQKEHLNTLEENRKLSNQNEALTTRLKRLEAYEPVLEKLGTRAPAPELIEQLVSVAEGLGFPTFTGLVTLAKGLNKTVVEFLNKGTAEKDIALLREFQEGYGTPAKIEETCDKVEVLLKSYTAIGTPTAIKETISRAVKVIKGYTALGKLEDLKKDKVELTKLKEAKNKLSVDQKVEKFSKRYELPVETVRPVVESMSEEKAEAALSALSTSRPGIRSPKTPTSEGTGVIKSSRPLAFFESVTSRAVTTPEDPHLQ